MNAATRPPRVVSVEPLSNGVLRVRFDNGVIKSYDTKPLWSLPIFEPLSNPRVFDGASVEPGGYAVVWGDFADVSEHELWQGGVAEASPLQSREA